MKKCIFILLTAGALQVHAQQPSIPQPQLTPQQKAMMKQMGIDASDPKKAAEQIKQLKQQGKQPDFKAQGQNMINNMMTDPNNKTMAAFPYHIFTNNTELIPPKDVKRISNISKKIFSDAEMLSNTQLLYNKLMAKIPAAEKAVITSMTPENAAGNELNSNAVTAMMEGHGLAALAMAMQAVMAKPADLNFQNNLAALLTQNGYPENAVPYLNKIQQQLPNNSTVKSNLGFAWLNLGETDSAQRILTTAAALNPEDPEPTTGVGVIEEKKGNIEAAGKMYDEAFVHDPSSMRNSILGNTRRPNPFDNITFDQIKDKITIYEYFTKEWSTVADRSSSVDGYQSDIAMLNGYNQMFNQLNKRVERIEDSVRNATDAEISYGLNSQAQNILKPIATYIGPFIMKCMEEDSAMDEQVKLIQSHTGDAAYDAKTCEARNAIWTNKYLQKVNPELKAYYPINVEKFRLWINAFITYHMLLADHTPKERLLVVLYYVKLFMNASYEAATSLKAMGSDCFFDYNNEASTYINLYKFPKLLCPTNVKITLNPKNLNANINKSAAGPVPNVSVALGSGEGSIAEPNKGGTPTIRSSQGEVSSSGINAMDAYGQFQQCIAEAGNTPATNENSVTIDTRLTQLANEIKNGEANAAPANNGGILNDPEIQSYLATMIFRHNLKLWLQANLATNCDDLKKMPTPPKPDIKNQISHDKQQLKNKLGQMQQQNNPATAQGIASGNYISGQMDKAEQFVDQKNQREPGWLDKFGGAVPTIVNSLQNPGTVAGFIKGLFN